MFAASTNRTAIANTLFCVKGKAHCSMPPILILPNTLSTEHNAGGGSGGVHRLTGFPKNCLAGHVFVNGSIKSEVTFS